MQRTRSQTSSMQGAFQDGPSVNEQLPLQTTSTSSTSLRKMQRTRSQTSSMQGASQDGPSVNEQLPLQTTSTSSTSQRKMPRARSKTELTLDASCDGPSSSGKTSRKIRISETSSPPLKKRQATMCRVIAKCEEPLQKMENVDRKQSNLPQNIAEDKRALKALYNNITRRTSRAFVMKSTEWVDCSKSIEDVSGKIQDKEELIGNDSNNGNFVKIVNRLQTGLYNSQVLNRMAERVYLRDIKWFQPFMKYDTEDLRITAITWHPTYPYLLVTGGKGGTLKLHKMKTYSSPVKMFLGMGPGCTIEAIRFNTKRGGLEVCTASVDGSLSCYNFDKDLKSNLVISEDTYRLWFCAVEIHRDGKTVYGGDSMGNVVIHHLDNGKTERPGRLHAAKIRHLECNIRDSNLMVTSSLDKTVKLWDIRKLDGKNSFVTSIGSVHGVSSAKFSRTDGCRLLTTDLNSVLGIYKAPLWTSEHQITHPHRHFQHLTIIKASWHPLADLFAVGRYPDPKVNPKTKDDFRCIDIYSASSGQLVDKLKLNSSLITSLAEFNSTGNRLASSSGSHVYGWKSSYLHF